MIRSNESNGSKPPETSRKGRISSLLETIEKKVTAEDGKASIADYVRLIQLERELEEEDKAQPRKLSVTWIEPSGTYDLEE